MAKSKRPAKREVERAMRQICVTDDLATVTVSIDVVAPRPRIAPAKAVADSAVNAIARGLLDKGVAYMRVDMNTLKVE